MKLSLVRSAIVTLGSFIFVITALHAWQGPSTSPTNGNVDTPITVGSTAQTRLGGLGLGTPIVASELLRVAGDAVVTEVLSSGKVQLVDVETEGAPCSSDGLVARDSVGAILSCQDGSWRGSHQAPVVVGADLNFSVNYYMGGSMYDGDVRRYIVGARTDGSGGLLLTAFADSCCTYYSSSQQTYVCSQSAVQSEYGCWFYAPPGGAYGGSYGTYGRAKVSGNTISIYTCGGATSCGSPGSAATSANGSFVGTATAS
jgi:hypothetical protein